MMRLKAIIALIISLAVATAGLSAYADSYCTIKVGVNHMIKDCPDCPEKTGNQEQHKNKYSGDVGCMVNCSSAMNMPAGFNTALPLVTQPTDAFHLSDDAVTSFFIQTQERPPKHLA